MADANSDTNDNNLSGQSGVSLMKNTNSILDKKALIKQKYEE